MHQDGIPVLRLNTIKGQFFLRLAKTAAEEKLRMSAGCFALPVLPSVDKFP